MEVSLAQRCPKGQVPLYLHSCIRVTYSELSPNLSAFFGGYVFHILLSTFCNRPYSRYPPSLHALRIDGIKAMSRGILGGKQKINFANARNHG